MRVMAIVGEITMNMLHLFIDKLENVCEKLNMTTF